MIIVKPLHNMHAQRSAEVLVMALDTGHTILRCPEPSKQKHELQPVSTGHLTSEAIRQLASGLKCTRRQTRSRLCQGAACPASCGLVATRFGTSSGHRPVG
eukprot:6177684-Pleurochrysis_carterae.AAC.1